MLLRRRYCHCALPAAAAWPAGCAGCVVVVWMDAEANAAWPPRTSRVTPSQPALPAEMDEGCSRPAAAGQRHSGTPGRQQRKTTALPRSSWSTLRWHSSGVGETPPPHLAAAMAAATAAAAAAPRHRCRAALPPAAPAATPAASWAAGPPAAAAAPPAPAALAAAAPGWRAAPAPPEAAAGWGLPARPAPPTSPG